MKNEAKGLSSNSYSEIVCITRQGNFNEIMKLQSA